MGTQVMALHYENQYKVKCLRRPVGCACTGCLNFNSFPEDLIDSISDVAFNELTRCQNAFVAWVEDIHNLVTTEGKNDQLSQYFKGSAYTAAFFIGLVNNTGFSAYSATDTAAQINGTNGWAETAPYSNATRVAWVGGSASGGSIDNTASVAVFNINSSATVRGAFVATASAKNAITGKLYGEADFSAARSVISGDSLNVTSTFTLV